MPIDKPTYSPDVAVARLGPTPTEPTAEQTAQVFGVDDPQWDPDIEYGRSVIANTEQRIARDGITGERAAQLREAARKGAALFGYNPESPK